MAKDRLRFAVLMDNAFSRFLEEYRAGIDEYAARAGADIAYFGVGNLDPAAPEAVARGGFLEFLGPREFDGLLLLSFTFSQAGLPAARAAAERLKPMPAVSIGPSLAGEDSILVDSGMGIGSVMEHLIRVHGYRDFAYVSGPFRHPEAAARLDAFKAVLAGASIPFRDELVYEGDFMPLSGMAAVDELLSARGLKPQAIVCANDLMAIGVREGLTARGLTVPYDIAVTGFDDVTILHGLNHQFTTVNQSFSAMGRAATARLRSLALGEANVPCLPLAPELVVRGSCGCVDLRDRNASMAKPQDDGRYRPITDAIGSAARTGFPGDQASRISRDCVKALQSDISENRPVDALERAIWEAARNAEPGSGSADAFLLGLHSVLTEESSQNMFISYWRDSHTNQIIRLALDRLQKEVLSDMDWGGHAGAFRDACDSCHARRFYLLRFDDPDDLSKGASVVFSYDGDGEVGPAGDWRPGPGSWLPPRGSSLVANMVTDGGGRFGYFLMDASAVGDETFEHFRVRLSQIHHDASILQRLRDLNAGMAREIEIRQDSERRLSEALSMVERLAVIDQLTGLNNRRGFLTLAEQEAKMLRRRGGRCLLLFADLDGLKTINDRWGHKEGDLAIQCAARILKESLRASDVVGRIGGDEFTALMSDADASSIAILKDRIAKACEKANRELGREWKLSLSIGFHCADPGSELEVTAMMEKADEDLYQEKKRNKSKRG